MFELNDQELEQVAGGCHLKLKTSASAAGAGSVDLGAVTSTTVASSFSSDHKSVSFASNVTEGIGCNVVVESAASSSASTSH